MKIYAASESEIDRRLALDRSKTSEAFCRGFDSESELPVGFMPLQDKMRDGLEKKFFESFADGVARSDKEPCKISWANSCFYFSAELIASERIIVDLNVEIVDDKLLGLILSYLDKCGSKYCVIAAVYSGKMTADNYLGRFVINLDEIAVEDSLADTWFNRVKFLHIEE